MDNYSSAKLELPGLKWTITEKFRDYLIDGWFTVYTDNNPLSYFATSKMGAVKKWWVSQLSQFNFNIKYRPGSANKNAVVLSRYPLEDALVVKGRLASLMAMTILPNHPTHAVSELTTVCVPQLSATASNIDWGTSQTTLPQLSTPELTDLQSKAETLNMVRELLKMGVRPSNAEAKTVSPQARKLHQQWDKLKLQHEVLYRTVTIEGDRVDQLVLPQCLVKRVLTLVHDEMGHQGIDKTLSLARKRCYWSSMTKDVERWCHECERHLTLSWGLTGEVCWQLDCSKSWPWTSWFWRKQQTSEKLC